MVCSQTHNIELMFVDCGLHSIVLALHTPCQDADSLSLSETQTEIHQHNQSPYRVKLFIDRTTGCICFSAEVLDNKNGWYLYYVFWYVCKLSLTFVLLITFTLAPIKPSISNVLLILHLPL